MEWQKTKLPIIIKSKKQASNVAVILPTNTWDAYNFYGNKSKYKDKQTPFIPRKVGVLKKLNKFFTDNPNHDVHKSYLPFNRPYLSKNLASNYKNIIRFLNDGKYDFNVFSDHDFSNNLALSSMYLCCRAFRVLD